jgi:Pyruvate/2-oxoacid:ferredoxin oxidoreductase gamma subunit
MFMRKGGYVYTESRVDFNRKGGYVYSKLNIEL